jgi:hypothetical protein
MKSANALSHESSGAGRRANEEDVENSPGTTEQQDVAAESMLAEIQMEQELDRIWFDCFIDLAEHHRKLRSKRVLDLWCESAQGYLAERHRDLRSERTVGRGRSPKL